MNKTYYLFVLLLLGSGIIHGTVGLAQKDQEDNCVGPIYEIKDVTQRAKVTNIPAPEYTEEARAKHVEGTVILTGVFCKDGTVKNIEVIKGLPYGLTENAVEATRHIEFQPSEKDGQVVSQRFRRECTFRLF